MTEPEPIPVLTCWQPWASLIGLGVKTIETRSWAPKYRGPLAIHAAARRPDPRPVGDWLPYEGLLGGWALEHYASGEIGAPLDALAPLGAIVATCTLSDVVPVVQDPGIGESLHDLPDPCAAVLGDSTLSIIRGRIGCGASEQRPYGDFTPGRFAWILADVVPLDPPVPFRGGQGLTKRWTPTTAVA